MHILNQINCIFVFVICFTLRPVISGLINLNGKDNFINKFSVSDQGCDIEPSNRFDCFPQKISTKEDCTARGCCYGLTDTPDNMTGPPICFYSSNQASYYIRNKSRKEHGLHIGLERTTLSPMPDDIMVLNMDVTFETDTRLRIKITDANPVNKRWEVPLDVSRDIPGTSDPLYSFDVANATQPFSFNIKRRGSNPTTLLSTAGGFVFADQFIQLSYYLPSKYIYGIGEHRDNFLHNTTWSKYVLWNRGTVPAENTNLRGSHPFYLTMENDGRSHGVLLLNSNALEVILQPAPALTWRTIGGVIDLYMFLGPTPDEVIQQYTEVIGRTFMPPYWSLGYHLCRWGYKTVNRTLQVTNNLRKYGIPQDTQWNDIDYAGTSRKDFYNDVKVFGNQTAEVDFLHQNGYHYIMLTDPAISNNATPGTYYAYDLGIQMDIFIKDTNGKPLESKAWPGTTVFPDFTHPNATEYWTLVAAKSHKHAAFDSIWIDMNQISAFVNGSTSGCPPDSVLDHPPYTPDVLGGKLFVNTICASGKQYISNQYNTHNIYGKLQHKATMRAMETIRGKRSFVLSAATFPGSGQYGASWSGDNFASFYDMYKSISASLSMHLFGVTMYGTDICGFRGTPKAEICTRWHQVGAFYSFTRDHNALGAKPQDPASFGPEMAAATRKVLLTRYTLLPYLYTLIHKSHVTGSTVLRALFFEFTQDFTTYSIDKQFMWGSALLISPVLDKGARSVSAYFPRDTWYDYYTGDGINSNGGVITLDAPLDKINLHVRGGYILPWQYPAVQTTISRKNKFGLLVALNSTGDAVGDLYNDDGETLGSYQKREYNFIRFTADRNGVYGRPQFIGYPDDPLIIGNVTIFGVSDKPSGITVNGNPQTTFEYNSQTKVLYITELSETLKNIFDVLLH